VLIYTFFFLMLWSHQYELGCAVVAYSPRMCVWFGCTVGAVPPKFLQKILNRYTKGIL
jgi:hypothetical protein